MRTKMKVIGAMAVLALVFAACNNGEDEALPTATPEDPGVPAAETVQLVDSQYGDILADGEGMTLYVFLNDDPNVSNCVDACAQTWPPLDPNGDPTGGEGVDADLLGTITRDDGSTQATYNSWPLYYYAADTTPGDTNGQGFGENWYVVSPEGEPVQGS